MKTISRYQLHFAGLLLLAMAVGLLWLLRVTSAPLERCERETVNIGLLKLI